MFQMKTVQSNNNNDLQSNQPQHQQQQHPPHQVRIEKLETSRQYSALSTQLILKSASNSTDHTYNNKQVSNPFKDYKKIGILGNRLYPYEFSFERLKANEVDNGSQPTQSDFFMKKFTYLIDGNEEEKQTVAARDNTKNNFSNLNLNLKNIDEKGNNISKKISDLQSPSLSKLSEKLKNISKQNRDASTLTDKAGNNTNQSITTDTASKHQQKSPPSNNNINRSTDANTNIIYQLSRLSRSSAHVNNSNNISTRINDNLQSASFAKFPLKMNDNISDYDDRKSVNLVNFKDKFSII